MSEINGPKFSVNQVNYSGIQKQNSEQPIIENSETTPQLTDFSDSKAEALGRSMLFKGVDDVNNDISGLNTKQIGKYSDELFETAYKVAQQVGAENPYEEAASASTTAV